DERLATSRAIERLFALTQRANANAMTTSEVQFVEIAFDEVAPTGAMPRSDSTVMFGMSLGSANTGAIVRADAPQEFEDIGHCLWTLLLALVGGVLAPVIQRTSRREQTPGPRSG
ncbi:MAG: hypothetical protein KY475_10755, partial [Planctomycetes bacterium]|nr:hypothetical protein [Planctomycetota bacterium]